MEQEALSYPRSSSRR